jgi:hypothetical protein
MTNALEAGQEFKVASIGKGAPTRIQKNRNSIVYGGYKEAILDTIYLVPQEVEAGLITEEKLYEIILWNAYSSLKILSTIGEVGAAGTELSLTSQLPVSLPPMMDNVHELKILKDGAPVQETTYIYSVSGDVLNLHISGTRILSFDYEPNWLKEVKIRLEFQTVIFENEKHFEQRRPLRQEQILSEELMISESSLLKEKLINDLKKLHSEILAVPIYNEASIITEATSGKITVSIESDITKYFFTQEKNIFLVRSIHDIEKSEVKEVVAKTANSLTFKTALNVDIPANEAVAYPCFIGVLEDVQIAGVTSNYVDVDVKLREVRI